MEEELEVIEFKTELDGEDLEEWLNSQNIETMCEDDENGK